MEKGVNYREEAIACVKDNVLPIHQQIYAKYNGDFDRIYTEAYNSNSYTGKVLVPGKVYELSYLECSCTKVKCGARSCPEQCECSRQSILYILSQLEPNSNFDVQIVNTILRGGDRCTFRITRGTEMKRQIAICGLDCEKCDAYIATKNNDQSLREKTAKLWSELNHAAILPEHINCEGCRMNGAKTLFCSSLCEIRKCAVVKGIETCGYCPEKDICPKVNAIWQNNPQARENLQK
jgi:hypothetical protein